LPSPSPIHHRRHGWEIEPLFPPNFSSASKGSWGLIDFHVPSMLNCPKHSRPPKAPYDVSGSPRVTGSPTPMWTDFPRSTDLLRRVLLSQPYSNLVFSRRPQTFLSPSSFESVPSLIRSNSPPVELFPFLSAFRIFYVFIAANGAFAPTTSFFRSVYPTRLSHYDNKY